MWGTDGGGHLHSQKSPSFVEAAQSYVHAKIALLFFLSIYSQVWRAGFLGRMTHYRVLWYTVALWIYFIFLIRLFLVYCCDSSLTIIGHQVCIQTTSCTLWTGLSRIWGCYTWEVVIFDKKIQENVRDYNWKQDGHFKDLLKRFTSAVMVR